MVSSVKVGEKLTAQEAFDRIVAHAATMPAKCSNEDAECLYRSETGGACFVGALIPDERYQSEWEVTTGSSGLGPREIAAVVPELEGLGKLLKRAQEIHDGSFQDDWAEELVELALEFDLDPGAVAKHFPGA